MLGLLRISIRLFAFFFNLHLAKIIYFSDLLLLHLDRALSDVVYDIAPGLVLSSNFQFCSRSYRRRLYFQFPTPSAELYLSNYS